MVDGGQSLLVNIPTNFIRERQPIIAELATRLDNLRGVRVVIDRTDSE